MNSTGTNYETEAPSYLGNSVPKLTKYDLAEHPNMTIYKELLSSGKLSSPIDGVPAFIIVDENQIEINRNIGAMSTKVSTSLSTIAFTQIKQMVTNQYAHKLKQTRSASPACVPRTQAIHTKTS